MGKTLADLQSNISISAENAVTGTLLWVDNYTGFSGDPAEQSGNYIALKISAEALGEALEGATITATYNGRTTTLDSDQIIIVRQAEGEDTITFTATKEGYTEGRLTLDLSGLTLEEEPFKFLIHSNSSNVVINRDGEYLPSRSEVEITGQVPWSMNRNQNDFSITINTKQEIVGEWVGANVRVYYNANSPVVLYSGSMSLTPPATIGTLTFTLPITAAAITNGTIYFEITELDDQSQVVNTYTVEADISNLTLKAGPQINITSDGTNLVIAPSTYSITKTATGTIPNTNDTDTQGLLALKLSYSNIPAYSRYILILRDENQNNILIQGNLTTLPTKLPVYINSNKIGRAGNKITFTIRDGNDQVTLATAELDVSQLSIVHSQFNITSNTTGITVSPSTYSVSKTMTGQVPYDTTSSSNKLILTIDLLNEVASSKYYFVQIRSGNSSGTVLAGGNKTFPASVEITLDSTNVTNGLYIVVGLRGSATGSATGIETITIDTSALTLEAAPGPSSPYTVRGTGIYISPTDEFKSALGNTVKAEDVMDRVELDSTTAGTQADPWIANINVIPYPLWGSTYYMLNIYVDIPTGATNAGGGVDSGSTQGICNIYLVPNSSPPALTSYAKGDSSGGPTSGTCVVKVTYFINGSTVSKYISFTITNQT